MVHISRPQAISSEWQERWISAHGQQRTLALEVEFRGNPKQANSALPFKQNCNCNPSTCTYTSPQMHVFLNTHLTKVVSPFSGVF